MPNDDLLPAPGDIFAYPSDDPQYYGMTLRDRFAIAALGAIIRRGFLTEPSSVAKYAYTYADAAIAARRPK